MKKIDIIIDTREKKPFDIRPNEFIGKVLTAKLDTADYSVVGLEKLLVIERKRNTSEIANNFLEKRFTDVLNRISTFKYKFIVCEFTYHDVINYPINSGIPPSYYDSIKINGNYIMSRIFDIQIQYGIHVMLCGHKAREVTVSLLKKVAKLEGLLQ